MSYQRPIFHEDNYGKYLLGVGPRYINVHQNWAGEYFFGTSFAARALCEAVSGRRVNPVLYRIVVKLKQPPESAA